MSSPKEDIQLAQQYRREAVIALDSGDYATAKRKVVQARMLTDSIADGDKDGASFRFHRDLSDLMEQIRRLEREALAQTSGAAGIQRIDVEYTRPGEVGGYT